MTVYKLKVEANLLNFRATVGCECFVGELMIREE